MKRIIYLFLCGVFFLVGYSVFLSAFPVNKKGFYSNEDRVEGFLYSKQTFPVVIVGSSLSGVLDKEELFKADYFSLYTTGSGGCTGVEVLRRMKWTPAVLFFEMNYIFKGIDSPLVRKLFAEPNFTAKKYLPLLLKQNMVLTGVVDRLKKKKRDTIDIQRLPENLYQLSLLRQKKAWWTVGGTARVDTVFNELAPQLRALAEKGCAIYFFEMPMDSSLRDAPLLLYERKKVLEYIHRSGGFFIPADTTKVYNTADGVHLLREDALHYNTWLEAYTKKIK